MIDAINYLYLSDLPTALHYRLEKHLWDVCFFCFFIYLFVKLVFLCEQDLLLFKIQSCIDYRILGVKYNLFVNIYVNYFKSIATVFFFV